MRVIPSLAAHHADCPSAVVSLAPEWYAPCATLSTMTLRLGQAKAVIRVKAKPSLHASSNDLNHGKAVPMLKCGSLRNRRHKG